MPLHLNTNTYYLLPTLVDTPPNRLATGLRRAAGNHFAHYCTSSDAITDINPHADTSATSAGRQDWQIPQDHVRRWCNYTLIDLGVNSDYNVVKAKLPSWLKSRTLLNEEIKNLRIVTSKLREVDLDGEKVLTWLSQDFVDLFGNQYYDFSDICGDSFTAEHNKKNSQLWNKKGIFVEADGPISIFPAEFKEAASTKMEGRKQSIKLRSLYRGLAGTKDPEWIIGSQTPKQIMSGNRIFLAKRKLKVMSPIHRKWTNTTILVAGLFGSMNHILTMTRAKNFFSMLLETQSETNGILRWMDPKAYKVIKTLAPSNYDEYYNGYSLVNDTRSAIGNMQWESSSESKALTDDQTKALALLELVRTAPWARARNAIQSRFQDKEKDLANAKTQLADTIQDNETDLECIAEYRNRIKQLSRQILSLNKRITNNEPLIQSQMTALIPKETAFKVMKQQFDTMDTQFNDKLKSYTAEAKNKELPSIVEQFSNMDIEVIKLGYFNGNGGPVQLSGITLETYFENKHTLKSVHFRTTKPMLMQIIDRRGVQIDTRVGGPWEVIVKKNNIHDAPVVSIRLASTSSIRGINPEYENGTSSYHWKPHPHVGTQRAGRTEANWASASQSWITDTCQGELAPNLITAFKGGNPKVVIYAMLTWLCAAYATDTWGRSYKWWPKPEDVMIEGGWNQKQKQLMHDLKEHEYIGSVGTTTEAWGNGDRAYRFSYNGRTLISETGTGAFLDDKMQVNKKRTRIFDSQEAMAQHLLSRKAMLQTLSYRQKYSETITAPLPPSTPSTTTPASDDQYVPVSNISGLG